MKAGDIVLAIFPQDRKRKLRPVLILKKLPKYNDLLVCAVSSQLHQHIPELDLLLDKNYPAFKQTGLKVSSVFRLSNLAVFYLSEVTGPIGGLSNDLHKQLLQNLATYLLTA